MTQRFIDLFLFMTANFFWSLGLMVFFLLYNIHLTNLGFSAILMGQVFAAGTLGTVLGSLLAGWGADRWGPKAVLMAATAIVAASLFWRAIAVTEPALLASSFITGVGISFWIVSVPPLLIAGAGGERAGARFSLAYGLSILTGAVAGVVGGHLPDWLGMPQTLAACGISCIFAFAFLAFIQRPGETIANTLSGPSRGTIAAVFAKQKYFLVSFLAMVLVWDLLLGLFPPFFNIFFTQHHRVQISGLGWIFSAAQFIQAGAVFSLPLWEGRLGLRKAIALCQVLCCPFFVLLALSVNQTWAIGAYLASASLQALTSPLIDQFLMANTVEVVRGKIAGIKFFISQGAVAVGAVFGGNWIETRGYAGLFAIISGLAVLSAVLTLVFTTEAQGTQGQKA